MLCYEPTTEEYRFIKKKQTYNDTEDRIMYNWKTQLELIILQYWWLRYQCISNDFVRMKTNIDWKVSYNS